MARLPESQRFARHEIPGEFLHRLVQVVDVARRQFLVEIDVFCLLVRLCAGLGYRVGRLFPHLHAGEHPLQLTFQFILLVAVRGLPFPFPGLSLFVLETPGVLFPVIVDVVEVGMAVGRTLGLPARVACFFRFVTHLDEEKPFEGLVEGGDVLMGLDQGGPQGRLEGRPFGDRRVPQDLGGVQGLGHGHAYPGISQYPGELNQPLDHGSRPA